MIEMFFLFLHFFLLFCTFLISENNVLITCISECCFLEVVMQYQKSKNVFNFLRIRLFQEINKTSISAVYFRSYLLGLNKFDFCKSIFIK